MRSCRNEICRPDLRMRSSIAWTSDQVERYTVRRLFLGWVDEVFWCCFVGISFGSSFKKGVESGEYPSPLSPQL